MLRKEEILERTSNGLAVFKHYLPGNWRIGRNFLNPLYEDSKASCNVYYDRRSGTYRMKDFGNGDFSGDCFFIVAKIKGLDCKNAADFVEILETIDRELCLGISEDVPPETVRERQAAMRVVPVAEENGMNGDGTEEPTGTEERAAELYGSEETHYLVNGSHARTGRCSNRSRKRNWSIGLGTG